MSSIDTFGARGGSAVVFVVIVTTVEVGRTLMLARPGMLSGVSYQDQTHKHTVCYDDILT